MSQSAHRLDAAAALLVGFASFLLFTGGGAVLHPAHTGWLMSGDPAAGWLGWQFFRDTPLLQWPLGANPGYGMELGSSIVFSDSIPLLALPLKLLDDWLPASFQYFGAWIASCFMLQAWFGWKLLRVFVADRWIALLGAAFFAIAPVLAVRLWGHYALMAQWLLLAALFLYFRAPISSRAWLLLLAVAALVHAYLLLMVFALFAADAWQRHWLGQRNGRQSLACVLAALATVLLVTWASGYFMVGGVSGVGVGNAPYGRYHMNLHGLVDPDQRWSQALGDRPGGTDDYEGFAFLGLGVLVLAIAALPTLFVRGAALLRAPAATGMRARLFPVLAMALALVVIALSNHVALGSRELFSYPLPGLTDPFTSAFRVSGRFIWPVYYLLYLGVFVSLAARLQQRNLARALFALLLVIQLADTADAWRHFGRGFGDAPRWTSPMRSSLWDPLAGQYDKLAVVLPHNKPADWVALAEFASRHGLATQAASLARVEQAAEARLRAAMARALVDGSPDADTLYVLEDDALWRLLSTQAPGPGFVGVVDGFRLLAPRGCARCDARALRRAAASGRPPDASDVLGFRTGDPGTANLLEGWWTPEPWGTWSDGNSASIAIDPLSAGESDLELILEGSAFLPPGHGLQNVSVSVNGRPLGILRYDQGSPGVVRRLRIPREVAAARQGRLLLRLDFHDAVSPASLGLGEDHRRLGLGLVSARVRVATD